MSEAIEYEFAEIDSKEEIVVHLGRLSGQLNLQELAELLHIPMVQILMNMNLEANWEIQREMYKMVRARLKELPPKGPGDEAIPLPDDNELEFGEPTEWMLRAYYAWSPHASGEGDAIFWDLPPLDLYLPRSPYMDQQLKMLYTENNRHERALRVVRVESLLGAITPLRPAVEKLEAAIERKFEKIGEGKSYPEVFGGISMLRTILDLQARHWAAEEVAGKITTQDLATHEERLLEINATVGELEDATWRQFEAEYIAPERRAADALLDLLDARSGDFGIHNVIEMAFTRPVEVIAREIDEVVTLTFRACNALARSTRVSRFVEEHVIDILDAEGRELQPAAEIILRTHGGQAGQDAVDEWNNVVAALRLGATRGDEDGRRASPLRVMGMQIRGYRLGLSATSAVLEQGVVAQVMTYITHGYAKQGFGRSAMQSATRGFALLLLRGLANSAVQHRAQEKELFVIGGERLSKIVSKLKAIDVAATKRAGDLAQGLEVSSSGVFWAQQGNELKKLQVRPVPRTAVGAVTRGVVSGAALMFAFVPLFDDDEVRADEYCAMASSLVSMGEHVGRALEFVVKGGAPKGLAWSVFKGPDALTNFDRTMKLFASVAAGISVFTGAFRAYNAGAKGDYGQMAIELAGGAGNLGVAFGQALMGPLQRRWVVKAGTETVKSAAALAAEAASLSVLRLGAVLNVAGVAIGIGAFLAQIVYDEWIDVGCESVMNSTLVAIERMPRASRLRDQFDYIRAALARNNDSMSALRKADGKIRFNGKSNDDAWRGYPTYWKAAKLGFSEGAVAKLFDADMADVGATLAGFYSEAHGGAAE